MEAVLKDLSPPALATAVEANLAAYLAYLARLPGGELHEEPQVTWFVTGRQSGLLNGVISARFDAAAADAQIDAVLAEFASRGVPAYWWTGPSTRPADLGDRLPAHGVRRVVEGPDLPGMAADLLALPDAGGGGAAAPSLVVEPALDERTLGEWCLGPPGAAYEAYAALGLGADRSLRHYVGRLDGRPVAKSSLFLGAGVAGVYNVFTLPDARRRGAGTAVTLAPLRQARDLGYRVGVLSSTAPAVGVYRRLGFREYTRIGWYEFRPLVRILSPRFGG